MIRRLLAALDRDRTIRQLRHDLTQARAEVDETTFRLHRRTQERDDLRLLSDGLRRQLTTTQRALDERDKHPEPAAEPYVDRAVQTPPPPASDRAEALRERARADELARRLADLQRDQVSLDERVQRAMQDHREHLQAAARPDVARQIAAALEAAGQPATAVQIALTIGGTATGAHHG